MGLLERARKYLDEQISYLMDMVNLWPRLSIVQKEGAVLGIVEGLMSEINEQGMEEAKRNHEFMKWTFKQAKGKLLEAKLDAVFNRYVLESLEVMTLKVA